MIKCSFLILLLLTTVELFGRLGAGVLYWDEAIYAQVSKEIIESGRWLTPHWNGRVMFHKPPVYFWATSVLFHLFGPSEFWARAASAFSGVGVLIVSYLTARLLYGHVAGILSGFILLSSQLFVSYARFGTTDSMLTFFVLLAIYGYLRAEKDDHFWVLAGAACGLALMVKGAAGLIAPAALILAALLERRGSAPLRNTWLLAGVVCAALLVLPWHVLMYQLYGRAFVNGYLFQHVLLRATSDFHAYGHSYGYYLWVLWEFFWPWVYVLPFALIFGRAARSGVLLILAAIVMCLYTLVQTKFQWYILPAIPPFAILIAGFITTFTKDRSTSQLLLALAALVLLCFAGTAGVISRLSRPRPEMEAGARLARLAARDEGGIAVHPEDLEMTVRYYSGRRLCTDPVLSRLSHGESTECRPGEATNMILRKADLIKVESRFRVEFLAEDGVLMYATITPKDPVLATAWSPNTL